jgi:ABC-type dipeptide/oligopeptide/nickel transport system permease component
LLKLFIAPGVFLLLLFAIAQLKPADPTQMMLGQFVMLECIEDLHEKRYVDEPIMVHYD